MRGTQIRQNKYIQNFEGKLSESNCLIYSEELGGQYKNVFQLYMLTKI